MFIKRMHAHLWLLSANLCTDLHENFVARQYLININFKFYKDLSLRWGYIALFVTLNNLEVKILGGFHPELLPKIKWVFLLFGTTFGSKF